MSKPPARSRPLFPMSSVDLNDPHITMAYDAIVHGDPLRWFLLEFGKKQGVLQIVASGTGDIDELSSRINPDHVSYGLFREPTQDRTLRLSVNHIPNSLKGVHRAKALVHGKIISNRFTSHESLTVSRPQEVTLLALRSTLRLPPRKPRLNNSDLPTPPTPPKPVTLQIVPPQSEPSPEPASLQPNSPKLSSELLSTSTASRTIYRKPTPHFRRGTLDVEPPSEVLIAQAFLETTDDLEDDDSDLPSDAQSQLPPKSNHSASTLPTPPISTPLSTSLTPWLVKQTAPLPPPPEQADDSDSQSSYNVSERSLARPGSPDLQSIPDSPIPSSPRVLHASPIHDEPEETQDEPDESVKSIPSSPHVLHASPTHDETLSLQGEPDELVAHWDELVRALVPGQPIPRPAESSRAESPPSESSSSESLPSEPVQRASLDSVRSDPKSSESVPTQRKGSMFKSRILTPAEEEEERRLSVLEEERKRRQAERTRREKEEREEEEARQREFEERREKERMRRLKMARKAEQQRAEKRQQQEEEEAKRKMEEQRKEEEMMQRRKNYGEQQLKSEMGMELMSGFITMEHGSQWKRRYYRLCTEQWEFYRNDEELTHPVHVIDLSHVVALKNWQEGYEELGAIPYSFAVELQDDAPCLFFADSAEDKEIILGLLNQAAYL